MEVYKIKEDIKNTKEIKSLNSYLSCFKGINIGYFINIPDNLKEYFEKIEI